MLTISIIIHPHIAMKSLTAAQHNHILSLLDKKKSIHQISSLTGLHISNIFGLHSKTCSTFFKSIGGHLYKLLPAKIIMPFILSLLRRLKMLRNVPKPCTILPTNLSHYKLSGGLKKGWYRVCGKEERAFTLWEA